MREWGIGRRGLGATRPGFGASACPDSGFTLVELMSTVAVLLVVMTAAWLLLVTASLNMDRVAYGGQASEANRAAFDVFERDIDRAVLRPSGQSPVLHCGERRFTLLADVDNDTFAELVEWRANDDDHTLTRSVTDAPSESSLLDSADDFADGSTQQSVVLDEIATAEETPGSPLFTYAASGTAPESTSANAIGLVTMHLRNGLPSRDWNVVDRTASFRVTVFVINGYN